MFFCTLIADPDRPKFDFKEGILTVYGNCIPENPDYSLGILFHEIYEYIKFHNSFTLILKFSCVSTLSSKSFLSFFTKLTEIVGKETKKDIRVIWHSPHIDEDIAELGEFYKEQSENFSKKNKIKKLNFKLKFYNYE
jgi:hypothetical protein